MSFNNKVSGSKGGSPQRCNDCCYEDSNTLSIIEEFKHLYEEKMRIIDKEGKGDGTMQAKLSLQQDWISDLTEQNEMLVRAVEELEQEATDRVLALEAKLAESSKSASEVMNGYKDISFNLDETFQQMFGLQNDVKNLIQLIHRLQDEGVWNLDGLQFCTVDKNTLVRSNKIVNNSFLDEKHGKIVQEKNEIIKQLERQICELNKCQNTRGYDTLKQSMLDMRDALTAEVADKHDSIVTLKRDVQLLEEQCRKADQQTHFKDDIIKELRKEIKQVKHENKNLYTQPIRPKSHSPIHMKPPAEPNPNKTYPSEKRFASVSCPIKSHKTLEKYKDFNNRVVIFVCEDQEQHEMHRLIDGDKMEVIYKNPKVVHEYETDALKKLHKDNTHVVGEGSKIYYTNVMDAPEKLSSCNESNRQQAKNTLKDLCMHSTDCKKEVVTSESTAATSSIICQHPPSTFEKAESEKMCSQGHCFTCVIECPACANTHRHFKNTDFERSVGIKEDIAQTIIKDTLSPVSKFTTSVSHYKSSQLHMRLINDIERMVAKDRKSMPGKSKSKEPQLHNSF